MSEQLRLRGDVAANVAAYTGPARETVVDTTNNRLVVQDGVTPGGWPAAKLAEVSRIARTAVTNSYSALATDRLIAVTQLVSAVTVTLPAAAAFQPGARLLIIDETGLASYGKSIIALPQGTDVLAGAFSSSIFTPYGYLELESNGVGQWTMSDGVSSTGAGSTSSSSSTASASASTGAAPFSGQAIIGVAQPVFSAVIAEPRLKAGMRPIVGVVNAAIASRGVLADVNITGFAAGEISVFGVLFTLDGKPAPAAMARAILTLNYIGV